MVAQFADSQQYLQTLRKVTPDQITVSGKWASVSSNVVRRVQLDFTKPVSGLAVLPGTACYILRLITLCGSPPGDCVLYLETDHLVWQSSRGLRVISRLITLCGSPPGDCVLYLD